MKMKKHVQTSLALGLLVLFATFAVAADTTKSAVGKTKASSPQKAEKSTKKRAEKPKVKSPAKRSVKTASKKRTPQSASDSKGRLPRYFGKLDLGDGQRERIYEVKAEYDAKISNLLAEIEELRVTRSSLYEKILEPSQRKKLKELADAAKKPRKAKKATVKVASKRGAKQKTGDGSQR